MQCNMKELINNVGSAAAAAPAATPAAGTASAADAKTEDKKEDKKEESESEDEDMGFGKNILLCHIITIKLYCLLASQTLL